MPSRTLISLLMLAALAVAPAFAQAAHSPIGTEVGLLESQEMAALDGNVVLVVDRKLIRRSPDGMIAPVPGAPTASYRSIDLGRDRAGELVLTYIRCSDGCRAYSDDLAGHRVTYKRLTPAHCRLPTAPSRWGDRVAYSLSCTKPSSRAAYDTKRSGLFVRTGDGAPKRLRTPRPDIGTMARIDLRGDTVGAVALGKRSYAFSQTVGGRRLRSMRVEDDGERTDVISMALGAGGALWTLRGERDGDGYWEQISRLTASSCDSQSLPVGVPADDPHNEQDGGSSGPGEPILPATAMAIDGDTIHLATQSAGLVTHAFSPMSDCL